MTCPHCHAPVTSENDHVIPSGLSCEYKCTPHGERCSNCDFPLDAHVINAEGKPLCADPPVDWRTRCLAAERDYCDALEQLADLAANESCSCSKPCPRCKVSYEQSRTFLGHGSTSGEPLATANRAAGTATSTEPARVPKTAGTSTDLDAVSAFAAKYPEE